VVETDEIIKGIEVAERRGITCTVKTIFPLSSAFVGDLSAFQDLNHNLAQFSIQGIFI
jgi:hypothetical protein